MFILMKDSYIEGYYRIEEFITWFNKKEDGINACNSFDGLYKEDIGVFLYEVSEFSTVRTEIHSKLLEYKEEE